ncbi:serine/threonine-protein kinase PINK1, mitochondrial-like [Branchiostoma floridae]|uniref:Serine/threonine-protein kinase PINK1, mitochondrial n=1 Tax=Branchiostoma floridae TaxID=7739 RepID=A0A9J7M9G6_BRAFL|nr:serine/threonine-protein kinase PINK1, mitochondrial-like [Branchiostoma floridae]
MGKERLMGVKNLVERAVQLARGVAQGSRQTLHTIRHRVEQRAGLHQAPARHSQAITVSTAQQQASSLFTRVLLPKQINSLAATLRRSAALRLLAYRSPAHNQIPIFAFVGLAYASAVSGSETETEEHCDSLCKDIRAIFHSFTPKLRGSPSLLKTGKQYKLEDFKLGDCVGQGCNAVVYEASLKEDGKGNVEETEEQEQHGVSQTILREMRREVVPARHVTVNGRVMGRDWENGNRVKKKKRLPPHPNIIEMLTVFTDTVPLLPDAMQNYPAALPPRFNPEGFGRNMTLFIVMKRYPVTLKEYLETNTPSSRVAMAMVAQLLEGVSHLVDHGIAHRDLKNDNILVELHGDGCPRLILTDFGCCLYDNNNSLQVPFPHPELDTRDGNSALMAPEVATATPGPGSCVDYTKSDVFAVGALAYEILGMHNPFYSSEAGTRLNTCTFREADLPPLPGTVDEKFCNIIKLLLKRDPRQRPSARVAANMVHLLLWDGGHLTSSKDLIGWLMQLSAVTLLEKVKGHKARGQKSDEVEHLLRREFLCNVTVEELMEAFYLFRFC